MASEAARTEAASESAEPFDAFDPVQVNKARQKAARANRARQEVVAGLMSTKAGRLWIFDTLVGCHIFTPSFVQGDPGASAFRDGERNVGLKLMADIMASAPDLWVKMNKEGNESAR